MSGVPSPHSELLTEERIPDELLPDGVGPAWWSPETMRAYCEAALRGLDHNPPIKAWVVLHLMNERQRLEEQHEALKLQERANAHAFEDSEREIERMKEQFEALREAVRKGLVYAEACESWPSTPSEKEHYRQEVESMRAALNPARELISDLAETSETPIPARGPILNPKSATLRAHDPQWESPPASRQDA